MMLQASLGQIAVQAYATFLGKCFEIVVVMLKGAADEFGKGHEKCRPGRDGLQYNKVETKRNSGGWCWRVEAAISRISILNS